MPSGDQQGCRYCDRSDRTREHALARQLAELVPQPSTMVAERLRVGFDGTERLSAWPTSTSANVVVRDFCSDCNGGWMNDLDSAIKAEFRDLCRGIPVTLEADAIERWTQWIVKQYFSYQAAYPDDYSRPADYHAFFDLRRPLPGMQVYVGLGRGLAWPHIHGQRPLFVSPLFSVDSAEKQLGLQVWTAGYGQLAIQVVHVNDPQITIRTRPETQPVARLWPDPEGPVELERLERLDEFGFARLTMHQPLFEDW